MEEKMNKSKKTLMLITIILDFLSVAALIVALIWFGLKDAYVPAEYTSYEQYLFYHVTYIVMISIDTALYLSAAICLSISIRKNGTRFVESKKVYMIGFVLNIIASPLSLASILLYIAHFRFVDIQYINEDNNDKEVVPQKPTDDELKEKVEKLRKLKEEGAISEEEFNEQILKLL